MAPITPHTMNIQQSTECCAHCGLPVPATRQTPQHETRRLFCCNGCEYVYGIINGLGLDQYYELKETSPKPASPKQSAFSHFADEAFRDTFVQTNSQGQEEVRLYLEGIHCAACVWLIEKLPEINPGVVEARVNFAANSVQLTYDPVHTALPQVAQALNSLGYSPHPVRPDKTNEQVQKNRRLELIRLGVAGACAGNAMMIAISLYEGLFSGIPASYQSFFHWLSLLVSLPAVFFSALPFYRAAWAGLRVKALHIDLPISLGILVGFFASAFNTATGQSHVYFDSVCMLIFLLLIGRWFQQRGIDRAVDSTALAFSLSPLSAKRKQDDCFEEVFVGSLQPGDVIQVEADEVIPADGIVQSGQSRMNAAVLTGESQPIQVGPGAEVYAGVKNIESTLLVSVTKSHNMSRVGQLMQMVEESERTRAPIIQVTDKLSAYFVATVLILAALTALYWGITAGFYSALNHTLALLVISCPCALGLSAPITLSVALREAARHGILIRGADVIERLCHTKRVYLDKTGTITEGRLKVGSVYIRETNAKGFVKRERSESEARLLEFLAAISCLEKNSRHPTAMALKKYADQHGAADCPDFTKSSEVAGQGVHGIDRNGVRWRIGSRSFVNPSDTETLSLCQSITEQSLSPVLVEKEGEVIAILGVGDVVRPEASETISRIKAMGLEIGILSGDVPEIVSAIAEQVGIPTQSAHGAVSPEEKQRRVKESQKELPTAMVGDGANDAAAFSAAEVGIGISGGAEICLKVADIFIAEPSLERVERAFLGAKRSVQVIHRNLAFSLFYNILGGAAAIVGYVDPLVAAVLMPLSSLTVVFSSALSRTFGRKDN